MLLNNIQTVYLLNKALRLHRQRHHWLPNKTLIIVAYSVHYLHRTRKEITFNKIRIELYRTNNHLKDSTLRKWIYQLRDKGYLIAESNYKIKAFTATVYTPSPGFFLFLADLESCLRETRIDR